MRAKQFKNGATQLWLSAADTYNWAHRTNANWPCSTISGSRLFVGFDSNGDLVEFALDGNSDAEVDEHELNAITSDFLRERFGPDHLAIRD